MSKITIKIPRPTPRQAEFLSDTHRVIAFGGARGGGKSHAIRTKALILAFRYAGIKQVIMRRSYPELTSNHINPLLSMLPNEVYSYNDQKKELSFVNGSKIFFRYCANDRDLLQYQGTETDILYIDEATQFSEEQFKILSATVRGVNNYPKRIYLTCNPGGVGHAFIKRLFITKNYKDGEKAEDYSFIKSRVTDNIALMKSQPEYISSLEALPKRLKEAWLYGNWDVFEGQFFEDFTDNPDGYKTRKNTHVIEPFLVPYDWKVYRSFDFGYRKPFSCGWWAEDHDGTVYRICELYGFNGNPNEGVRWSPDRIFEEIAKIEREHPNLKDRKITGVADPSIWDSSRGESVYDRAMKHGILMLPGNNRRISGWMQFHERLRFDDEGYPSMYIFSNCKEFIRTIPTLKFDMTNVEDLDTDGEDHIADETRYFLMSRPVGSAEKNLSSKMKTPFSPLDIETLPSYIPKEKMMIFDD